jgi:hypothetical protein
VSGTRQTVSCLGETSHATTATRSYTCSATGALEEDSAQLCQIAGCEANYRLDQNACIPQVCVPGTSLGQADCRAEVPGAASAGRSVTCNSAGNGYVQGSCVTTGCQSGFIATGNACLAQACAPRAALGNASCASEIPFAAVAAKSKACNVAGDGYTYGACVASSCQSGYLLQNNSCVPQTCAPSASLGDIDCAGEIPFSAVALKSRACNSAGDGYRYGACAVSTCQSGYLRTGNSCAPQACVPGAATASVSCTAEIPFSASATKSKTCNSIGDDFDYGPCSLAACQSGYVMQSGACVPQACTPGQSYGAVSCVDQSPYATAATRTQSCDALGTAYVYGPCTVTSCQIGSFSHGNYCSSYQPFSPASASFISYGVWAAGGYASFAAVNCATGANTYQGLESTCALSSSYAGKPAIIALDVPGLTQGRFSGGISYYGPGHVLLWASSIQVGDPAALASFNSARGRVEINGVAYNLLDLSAFESMEITLVDSARQLEILPIRITK